MPGYASHTPRQSAYDHISHEPLLSSPQASPIASSSHPARQSPVTQLYAQPHIPSQQAQHHQHAQHGLSFHPSQYSQHGYQMPPQLAQSLYNSSQTSLQMHAGAQSQGSSLASMVPHGNQDVLGHGPFYQQHMPQGFYSGAAFDGHGLQGNSGSHPGQGQHSASSNLLSLDRPLLPGLTHKSDAAGPSTLPDKLSSSKSRSKHKNTASLAPPRRADTLFTHPTVISEEVALGEGSASLDAPGSPSQSQAGPSSAGKPRGRSRRNRTLSRTLMANETDPNVRPYGCGVPECKIRWKQLVAPGEPETIELAQALNAAGWQRPTNDSTPLSIFSNAGALSDHMRSAHQALWDKYKTQRNEVVSGRSAGAEREALQQMSSDPTLQKLFCCTVPKCGKAWTSINGLQYHVQVSGRGKHGHWRSTDPILDLSAPQISTPSSASGSVGQEGSWRKPLGGTDAENVKGVFESQRERVDRLEAEQPWVCPFTEEATGLPSLTDPPVVGALTLGNAQHGTVPHGGVYALNNDPRVHGFPANAPMHGSRPPGFGSHWSNPQPFQSRNALDKQHAGPSGFPLHHSYAPNHHQNLYPPNQQPLPSQQQPPKLSPAEERQARYTAITAGFPESELSDLPCKKRFRQRGGLAYHIMHAHRGLALRAVQYMRQYPTAKLSSLRALNSTANLPPAPPQLISPMIDTMIQDPTLKRRLENDLLKSDETDLDQNQEAAGGSAPSGNAGSNETKGKQRA
jgi:hypothetical protein